jgi:hypothetical protein
MSMLRMPESGGMGKKTAYRRDKAIKITFPYFRVSI